MDKHFSLYLDLVRFTAAALVVLSHYTQHGVFGPAVKAAGHNLGREAVIVFFILSGFVIAWSAVEKALTLRQYVVARAARIYAVAAPLVLLAFGTGLLAMHIAGVSVESGYQLLKPWVYLPMHLLFMGELWTLAETPPWLVPYWSLGYEVWYYVLFGVVFYGRGRWRWLLTALVLLVMGPKLWLLLPVWLAGACLYRYQGLLAISTAQARAGCVLTLAALLAYKLLALDVVLREAGVALWPFPGFPLSSANRYLADYLVAVLMYAHFCFARQACFTVPARWQQPIRALAAYTFPLYLAHGLVLGWWEQFYGVETGGAFDVLLLTVCIGLATYACGVFTERQRDWLRRRFDRPAPLAAQGMA
ncbi:acyltransferase [Massilia sp. CF038]|uniref:acyltransferase family protein n=1 Tax=Massilia sp. CF038 TaxID=1881045 RepID=UPI0009234401|nr:acyltransferase [Massilia sp. CF038]SHH42152.1 Peptidoglycan/LPS O-acetylase OafA/YrhL, contains acyltransferase and SGNH-hydrolase domains [Massilia sp. CF038]